MITRVIGRNVYWRHTLEAGSPEQRLCTADINALSDAESLQRNGREILAGQLVDMRMSDEHPWQKHVVRGRCGATQLVRLKNIRTRQTQIWDSTTILMRHAPHLVNDVRDTQCRKEDDVKAKLMQIMHDKGTVMYYGA